MTLLYLLRLTYFSDQSGWSKREGERKVLKKNCIKLWLGDGENERARRGI